MIEADIERIDRLDATTLLVDSRSLDGAFYESQLWERAVATGYARCALTGKFIYPRDAVYRPDTVLTNKGWCMLAQEVPV